MVLRARWILGGAGETDGEEEAVAEEDDEDEGAGGRTDLLLPGPETLIFARPGDNVEDVEGEEDNDEGDVDGIDFAACPAAGLCGEEEAGERLSPSSPALEPSFPDGCDDDSDDVPPIGSVVLAAADVVEAALSSFI